MMDTTYNVGIYCRLSNDDERDGESVSIENQKLLLQNYVRQRGWNEVDVYIDDGYSGTNFNRPGVRRLIEDAKAKRINVILVKDLSRFGRNYIEFGQYTDYLFPSLGCRFIALNNGIDTMSDNGSTDVMCFLNLCIRAEKPPFTYYLSKVNLTAVRRTASLSEHPVLRG